jgi:hypothetical protein
MVGPGLRHIRLEKNRTETGVLSTDDVPAALRCAELTRLQGRSSVQGCRRDGVETSDGRKGHLPAAEMVSEQRQCCERQRRGEDQLTVVARYDNWTRARIAWIVSPVRERADTLKDGGRRSVRDGHAELHAEEGSSDRRLDGHRVRDSLFLARLLTLRPWGYKPTCALDGRYRDFFGVSDQRRPQR